MAGHPAATWATAAYVYAENGDLAHIYDLRASANASPNKTLHPTPLRAPATPRARLLVPVSGNESGGNDELARRVQLVDNAVVTNDYDYDYDARAETPASGLVPGMGVAVGRDACGYGYDANGNMLAYGGWTLGWNGENRLVLASNGATRVTFAYDSMGRRFLKAVGATTNRYTYDGWAMIREADGSRTNDYAYGLDLSGSPQGAGTIGGLLMATLDGTNAFYCYDANGNVTELVDGGGNTVAAYRYDPFGNTIGKSGALADANPFRFSTKYLDGETDLYYYGLRFYSPKLGRWLSRDPVGERSELCLYNFAHNNGVCYIDKDGRFWQVIVIAALIWLASEDDAIAPGPDDPPGPYPPEGPSAIARFALEFCLPEGEIAALGLSAGGKIIGNCIGKAGVAKAAACCKLVQETAEITIKTKKKIDPNKLKHIFENPTHDHKLQDLLKQFGGDQGKALEAIQDAVEKAAKKQCAQGKFELKVTVGQETVTVTGKVLDDGTVAIGTAFKP